MLQPGDRIDIWVVERQLGSGGMGSVYRCHNHAAQRILAAIKVLDGSIARHPEARARFIREAEILFTLDHPNIVKVRNVRVDSDTPYIEMEFVQGESLEDRLARAGGMDIAQAVPFMLQMAQAIDHLHVRGVRHRDIKPANVLIDAEGRARLVDFGLAMEADASRLTQGQMSFGTVSYAPPEWIDPDKLDPVQWDLYALGVVFWEMLTGAVAFPVSGEGNARQQAFQVILSKQGHPPLDPGAPAPEGLRALLRGLTAPDPSKRIQSAADVVARLQALGEIESGVRVPTPVPVPRGAPVVPVRAPEPTIIPPESEAGRLGSQETFALDGGQTGPFSRSALVGNRDTLLRADIEAPVLPRRRGLGTLVAIIGSLAAVGALGTLAVAAAVLWGLPATTTTGRPVDLNVTGLSDQVPYALLVDDRAPDRVDDGPSRFDAVEPGPHTLTWVVGAQCDAVPCSRGRCPDWCLHGQREIEIPEGEGPFTLDVSLAAPAPRPVRVGTSALDEAWPLAIAVEGAEGSMNGRSWRSSSVQPGVYRARVLVGDCPDAPPCEDRCPPGCRDAVRELVVPVGDGRLDARLQIEPPEGAPQGSPTAPSPSPPATVPTPNPAVVDPAPVVRPVVTPTPEPTPVPATGSGRLVTAAQYARWLADHPDWSPSRAQASGLADGSYLFGWTGDTPPPDLADKPAQNLPHLAAQAYCQGRGGLARADQPPTSWDEGSNELGYEWRLADGTPALLESNGTVSTKVRRGQSLPLTGFRCAR